MGKHGHHDPPERIPEPPPPPPAQPKKELTVNIKVTEMNIFIKALDALQHIAETTKEFDTKAYIAAVMVDLRDETNKAVEAMRGRG